MNDIIVFDIGGTDTKFGIISNGKLINKNKMPSNAKDGGDKLINNVINKIKDIITKDTIGIAISTAGVIDPSTGVVVSATDAIPNYIGLNIKKLLEDTFKLPTWVQNDVNCFAIAEKFNGHGKDVKDFITLTVGTGIGGAIYINNELYLGKDFSAGEVGRMNLGNSTFEGLASITGLIKNAKVNNMNINNGLDVFNLYDSKDEIALKVVGEFYMNLAKGISNLVYLFNPTKILIGGAISTRESFITELSSYLDKTIDNKSLTNNILTTTLNKNDSGLLGAYYNFIDKQKKQS